MTSLRKISLLALALTLPALAHAGIYLKFGGLYSNPSDVSVNSAAAFKASLKNNVGLSGAVGYKLSVFRVEAELQQLKNSAEANETSGTLLAGNTRDVGSLKETSGFANAYVDFPAFFGLAPYLGAGLGYARINADGLGRTRNNAPLFQYSGRDSVFGYQGMAGLQYHLFGQATLHGGFRLVKRDDIAVREVVANAGQTLSLGTNRVFELGVSIGF